MTSGRKKDQKITRGLENLREVGETLQGGEDVAEDAIHLDGTVMVELQDGARDGL